MTTSRRQKMKKTRNPQTGQLIQTEPTPEELARLHAKASVGQRRVVGEIESNPLMVRYVAACVEAIRKGSPMTVAEIREGLAEHYGLKGSHQVVQHYLTKRGWNIGAIRNGKA